MINTLDDNFNINHVAISNVTENTISFLHHVFILKNDSINLNVFEYYLKQSYIFDINENK